MGGHSPMTLPASVLEAAAFHTARHTSQLHRMALTKACVCVCVCVCVWKAGHHSGLGGWVGGEWMARVTRARLPAHHVLHTATS